EAAPRGGDGLLDLGAVRLERGAHADDVGPRLGEGGRHREADAAAGTGDDGRAAAQVEQPAHRWPATSTRIFMARPASRSSKAERVSDSGTIRVMSVSAGMSPRFSSSTAVSKSARW